MAYRHSDADFADAVKTSTSVSATLKKLGLKGNYKGFELRVKALGLDTSHFIPFSPSTSFPTKRSLAEVLVANSPRILSPSYKPRIVEEGLLEYKCVGCGLTNTWQGKPITLQLDHISGDHFDHRIENLRFLCPNCHSQTSTFGSKNKPPSRLTPASKYLPVVKPEGICLLCGGKTSDLSIQHCKSCYDSHRAELQTPYERPTKIIWPSVLELKERLKTLSYLALSKELGVSDASVRKRIRYWEAKEAAPTASD